MTVTRNGKRESTGVWGKTPLKWPLAIAGLSFFAIAGGFAVADEDLRVMLYTCVVMGATLIGAWVYALGSNRYPGESNDPDTPRRGVSLDTDNDDPTNTP